MIRKKPSITSARHLLPFDKLSPLDFERLCLWLVQREGFERAEHLGAAGSEQGRDIIAWQDGELWAFQCKRVQRFGEPDAIKEIKRVHTLPEAQQPAHYVFIVSSNVRAEARQKVRTKYAGKFKVEFWAYTELDEMVKRHPDIIAEFFNLPGTQPEPAETPGLWVGVPSKPPHFVGRDGLVSKLVSRLTKGDSLALSLAGPPGAGKTALAITLTYHPEVLAQFKDGILWASLGPQGELINALYSWATALGISPSSDEKMKTDAEDLCQNIRDEIGRRRMLLVLEDVWDLEAAQMLKCGGPLCCYVLTTRDSRIAQTFAGTENVELVPVLEKDDAFHFLQVLAREACRSYPDKVRQLIEAVGRLPLALNLLGGYLGAPEHSLFDDLGQAALEKLSDPELRLQLAQRRLGTTGPELTLKDTISLSLEGLAEIETGREAVSVFYTLGVFAPNPARFSLEAAREIVGAESASLALLVAHHLLEKDAAGLLTMHQVISEVARHGLRKQDLYDDYRRRQRRYYLQAVNSKGIMDPSLLEQLDWGKRQASFEERDSDEQWLIKNFLEGQIVNLLDPKMLTLYDTCYLGPSYFGIVLPSAMQERLEKTGWKKVNRLMGISKILKDKNT